ncbi:MAG: hypothetical protein H0X24_09085, partial [Ktedonobacterales bacterium]|nr:hypothetical protein [Ktedonobacterales bacterium]
MSRPTPSSQPLAHKQQGASSLAKSPTIPQPILPRRRWLNRGRLSISAVIALLVATSIGVTLNRLGIWVPLPSVTTLAALPAPKIGAAYSRVAEDMSGDLWVAQSAPGLADNPNDATLLTIITPDQWSGNRVVTRLCLGCASAPGPALARIDDIARDPRQPHALYVAGWTTAQGSMPSTPIVVGVAWQPAVRNCGPFACGLVTTMLTSDTSVDFLGNPADHNTPLLRQLLRVGVTPVLALASARDGTLYCFLSDRGRDSLSDAQFNLVGGFQGVLRYDPLVDQWNEVYVGPGDRRAALHLSPTSTVTAMALDTSERYLYVADGDHHAIYRADLRDPLLGAASPYAAAGAFKQIAGQPLVGDAYADVAQAVPGWSGDGGSALAARLNAIRGLAFDAAGDLLVSDVGNARLRLITPAGTIWTVAGRGVHSVDGDSGAPLDAGLGGLLGLTADGRGRVFLTDGAALDGTRRVRVRQLAWGWQAPQAVTTHSARGAQGLAGDVTAALLAANATTTTATVLSMNGCTTAPPGGCARPYSVLAGGTLPDQAPLVLPQSLPSGDVALPSTPTVMTNVSGTHTAVIAGGTQVAFISTVTGQSLAAPMMLPDGVAAMGVAVLTPQTDAQLARLGAAYLLVTVQGGAAGPQLLVYKATADTCGLHAPPKCASFPGTPTLAATLTFTATSVGSVGVALSDDAQHAFALVTHPADGAVSAVDLSPWLANGQALAVTTRLSMPNPSGALSIRHDGLAAYTGTNGGQLGIIDTNGWLARGIPATAPAVAMVGVGATDAAVVSLALAGDDTRLFAALSQPNGNGQLVMLAVGGFAQPSTPQSVSASATEAQP